MSFFGPLLTFIVVLGIIVLVHECGHFFAARLMKIRVETFSIGFGPAIWKRKRKDTEFRLSIIPLGGYVKLLGEDESENTVISPDNFLAKNRAQKIFTLIMGSVMNIILAIVVIFLINLSGVEIDSYKLQKPEIGFVSEASAAEKAGLQSGDLILKINNRPIKNWEQLELTIATSPNEELQLEIMRRNEILSLSLKPDKGKQLEIGYAGIVAPIPAIVGEVTPGMPAEKVGLKKKDRIIAIDETPCANYFAVAEIIRKNPEKKLTFTVVRNDQQLKLEITPIRNEQGYGQIGFQAMLETKLVRYSLPQALAESIRRNLKMSTLVFESLKKILTGKLSPKSLSGPIEIARFSHQALESGLRSFFFLIAFISLQLGLINLFPIPALDGGHIFILTIETILRRDLPLRLKNLLLYIGFAFLILLMAFVILNDIIKTLPDGWKTIFPF